MSDFQTVVVGIDGEPAAPALLRLAHAMSRSDAGDRFFILHAVRPMNEAFMPVLMPYACLGDDLHELQAELMKHAGDRQIRLIKRHLSAASVEHLRIGYGHVDDAILGLCGQLGPDILVLGRSERHATTPGELGSSAQRLVRRAPFPVMLAAALSTTPRVIAYATDLTRSSRSHLEWAVRFADAQGAVLVPIHVTPAVEALDHAGTMRENKGAERERERAVGAAKKLYTQLLEGADAAFSIRSRIDAILQAPRFVVGEPGRALVDEAQSCDADTIIVGRARPAALTGSRMGAVARHVVENAPGHVIVLPAAEHRTLAMQSATP